MVSVKLLLDMRVTVFFILIFCGALLCCFGCGKDDKQINDNYDLEEDFEFIELKSSTDSIRAGVQSAAITAIAKGVGLTYQWSASGGTLFGSGAEVGFHTSVCTQGAFTINCTVSDKRGYSDKKSIVIVSHP